MSNPVFSFSVCTPTPYVSACVTHSNVNPLTVSVCAGVGTSKVCTSVASTPEIYKNFTYMSDHCH